MNTILFLNTVAGASKINVIETVLPVSNCKSFAGGEFNLNPIVTSASVIDENGTEVLLLEKDENGKCTKRISK